MTARTRKATDGSVQSSSGAQPGGSVVGVGTGRKTPKNLVLRHRKEGEIQREILRFLGVERRGADGELTGVFVSRQGDGMFWDIGRRKVASTHRIRSGPRSRSRWD